MEKHDELKINYKDLGYLEKTSWVTRWETLLWCFCISISNIGEAASVMC